MAGLCTAQCKMVAVLCEITVCDLYSFELACLKEKEEETDFGCLATFWFGTFLMFYCTIRSLAGHENA